MLSEKKKLGSALNANVNQSNIMMQVCLAQKRTFFVLKRYIAARFAVSNKIASLL